MKDPSFPFYAQDFYMDTLLWTEDEVGAWTRLLAYWWINGPTERSLCLRITRSAGDLLDKYPEKILEIDGKISSRKLEEIRTQREAHREKQRANGSKGGRPKKNPDQNPTKNPNETQDKSQTKPKKKPLEKEDEKEKEREEEKEPEVVWPWTSPEFVNTWELWMRFRAENKWKKYKTIGLQAALKGLAELSGNDEATAIKIINQSMTNSWMGFFQLKQQNNGKPGQGAVQDTDKLHSIIAQRIKGPNN